MYVIAARYRVRTADCAKADAIVRVEQDPLTEQHPGFTAETRLVEGTEGDTTRLVIVALWRDRAAMDDYFARGRDAGVGALPPPRPRAARDPLPGRGGRVSDRQGRIIDRGRFR